MVHRILVVEDEAAIAELVVETLCTAGFEVIQADTADQALNVLQGPTPIDLLFTDLGLPGGMTGEQLIAAALRIRPAISVVYTTGYTSQFMPEDMPMLAKPYLMSSLIATIRAQLPG